MATWHQQKNPTALAALWAPHPTQWKCVSDKPGQMAGCASFTDKQKARDFCDNTGAVLIPPSNMVVDHEHNDTRLEIHRAVHSVRNPQPRPERLAYRPRGAA
jgi:hypothetical protein